MKIEKYKKLKDDKYRITLDNGTVIDIYEDVIIKNNLLYKKEIDINLLNQIESDNEYQKVYDMALKYIMVRLRSVNEIKVYLKKKNVSLEVIEDVVDKLIKNNFLNDDNFARAFIQDKLNFTSMGKYKLINELNILKVDNDIIDKYINDISDDVWLDRIDKLINKYLKSKHKYSGNVLKNKIYIYLVNLGYDKSLVINILNNYEF